MLENFKQQTVFIFKRKFMTPEEILLIDEKFKGLTTLVNAQFDHTHMRLDKIEKQTSITNGRVSELERKALLHVTECPVNPKLEPRIRVLEDSQLSVTAVKKTMVGSVAVVGGIMGIIWVIAKLFLGV